MGKRDWEEMRALIVESGFTRGALAACRALHRAGWTVGIGSPDRHGLAPLSRTADRWHDVPRVVDDLDGFLEATERAIRAGGYEVVFCAEDAEALGLSFGRDRLSAIVPYPPHDVVLRAFDKLELCKAARRVGMRTPQTTRASERAIAHVDLPVLVKSRLHWSPGARAAPARLEALFCSERDAVRRRVHEIRAHGGEAVLQEVILGRQVHYMVIVDQQGRIVTGVQTLAEPLLYSGPVVGQRVRSVSVPVDRTLHQKTAALMTELQWVGMMSVMLLAPDAGGEPVLTDFNGRFQSSADQYIAAGPNAPAIWAHLATGRRLPPIDPVEVGVRYQWLEGDLRRALNERRRGLFHDVLDCLSFARGAVHTVLRADDPLPALRLGMLVARQIWGKITREARAMRGGCNTRSRRQA